jgi:hypoxanthine-DNA glycosylase
LPALNIFRMRRAGSVPSRELVKRKVGRPLLCSFPPIAAADARVLVLGTRPSVASLAKRQFYGHPQNAFWPIMGRLFGAGPDVPYEDRKRILCKSGVAVWDVLRECHREGSLDSAIEVDSEVANDFLAFLAGHRRIHSIFFNGTRAETAFRRHALASVAESHGSIRYTRLPSTSPAHAGRNFAQKLAAWRAVKRAVSREATIG